MPSASNRLRASSRAQVVILQDNRQLAIANHLPRLSNMVCPEWEGRKKENQKQKQKDRSTKTHEVSGLKATAIAKTTMLPPKP